MLAVGSGAGWGRVTRSQRDTASTGSLLQPSPLQILAKHSCPCSAALTRPWGQLPWPGGAGSAAASPAPQEPPASLQCPLLAGAAHVHHPSDATSELNEQIVTIPITVPVSPPRAVGALARCGAGAAGRAAAEAGESPAGRGKAAAIQGILMRGRRWGAAPNPHGRSKDSASRGVRMCVEREKTKALLSPQASARGFFFFNSSSPRALLREGEAELGVVFALSSPARSRSDWDPALGLGRPQRRSASGRILAPPSRGAPGLPRAALPPERRNSRRGAGQSPPAAALAAVTTASVS